MDPETGASTSPDSPSKLMTPPAFSRSRSQRPSEHINEDHVEYDPNTKVEFMPPSEGTPAALALAGMCMCICGCVNVYGMCMPMH
ncbi:hypothetical protein EON63_07620 [archaeon]|nr:MAG: hypothetical protein EON63_07620 [archaeon]